MGLISRAFVPDTLTFAIALIASALLTPAIRNFAVNHSFFDVVGSVRKVHTRPVPRLGGIAIILSWLIATSVLLAISPSLRERFSSMQPRATVFVVGALLAAALGLADDIWRLRARYKLAVQLGIGALLCWGGFTIEQVQLPGDVVIPLGVFAVPFTMLWVAGVMNAMNLIDGLDGLAGGVAAIAAATAFVLALVLGKPLLAVYMAAMLGALGGFLFYNFHPASIFMGDAGSLFLGYFLSAALLVPARDSSWGTVEIAVPLVILGVPIADTAFAIARRVLRNRGVFSPDRRHLHHRLLTLGMSHRQAVLTIYGLSAALAIAAFAIGFGDARVDLVICAALLAVAVATFHVLGPFDLRIDAVRSDRRRNAELRASVIRLTARLQHVDRIDEVFDSIHQLAPAVAASAVRARIGSVSYEAAPTNFSGRSFEAHFPLSEGAHVVGDIVVVWGDGRNGVDDDQALAIEQICDSVARAILRVSPDVIDKAANDLPPARRHRAAG